MSPQERRIDMRDQGTIGGHGHSHKDPRHENAETSWKLFTEASDRTRGGQESSGYIPEQNNCTSDQQYNKSSKRRRDGEIQLDSTQGRDSYSKQQSSMISSSQRRGKENRANSPANISGRTIAQTQGYSVQRPGGVDLQGSWRSENVVEDFRSREPRHSGNGRGHTGQKLGKSHFPLTASENINSLLTDLFSKARNTLSSPPSSPPLTPLTSSAVSSPSSKGKQKCYPPELSALSYMTITSPLTALESPSKYTDNEVGLRLTFFEKTNSRNLTPRSQIFIDLYQKTSLLLLSETDSTKRALHQSSLQLFDQFLEENNTILNETRSHAELRDNLSRLKLFEYYSRYGDYFSYQSSKLRKIAFETQTSGHKIFRDYWDKVSQDIVHQMNLLKDHPKTPTSRLQSYLALMNVAEAMGVGFDHLLTSISAYATRNRLMHSAVNEFIQNGKFHDLAKILHEDERDLPLIIPYERSEEKIALLQIIATIKEEFFDVDQDFPDDYQSWNHTRKGKIFKSNQALALRRSDELAAQAASLAAKEQKSADEATAAFEAIQTDRRMKRKASKEIPDIVRGEEEERSKKHAKLLGIQKQVDLQENLLTRLYEKRSEVWSEYGNFETLF